MPYSQIIDAVAVEGFIPLGLLFNACYATRLLASAYSKQVKTPMQAEIDSKLAVGLRCSDRATGLDVDANPVQIYFNLGMDRVHYVPQASLLYFANSSHFPIQDIISAVYAGLGEAPQIEQLFLDKHGYYKGAQRIKMSSDQARAVMVALRLRGIKISIATDTPEQALL